MPKESIFEVQAQEDFVEKLAAARPAQALAELVWNGLDAEATKVSIEVDRGTLGLKSIRIRDNGHGIAPEEAAALFTHLGGSWKRGARQSKHGKRVLHGEEGKGRFRALALGRVAEWSVTAKNSSDQRVRYRITMIKDSARTFRITDPEPVDDDCKIGVEVTISEPYKDWNLETPGLLQELNEVYALYLTDYSTVRISLLGAKLDPTKLIELRKTVPLPSIANGDRPPHSAELEVVEWKTQTERMLYLCSADGFPLHRILPGIHAPGFDFSAYLRSPYVSELNEQGALGVAELDARLNESVENAKTHLREHFKARTKEKLKNLVDEWKTEQVYPYADEPATAVQTVERQVFDIVAVNVATSLPDFQTQDQRNRKFQLRMLRHSIERSPEEVQLIIGEVLGLSQRKQEELVRLLRRTTLSAIITASKLVADRLDFVSGLETMLFDTDLKKHFKEIVEFYRQMSGWVGKRSTPNCLWIVVLLQTIFDTLQHGIVRYAEPEFNSEFENIEFVIDKSFIQRDEHLQFWKEWLRADLMKSSRGSIMTVKEWPPDHPYKKKYMMRKGLYDYRDLFHNHTVFRDSKSMIGLQVADICANICYRFYRDDRQDIRAYTLLWRRIMCEGKAEIHVITVDERSLHEGDLSEQVGVLDVDEYQRLADERERGVNAGSARDSP